MRKLDDLNQVLRPRPTCQYKKKKMIVISHQTFINQCKGFLRNFGKSSQLFSKWSLRKYSSNLKGFTTLTKVKDWLHPLTNFNVAKQWAPFTSTTMSLQLPHDSVPGSRLRTLTDWEKLVFDDLQNTFSDIQKKLQNKNQILDLLSHYYFDGKGKAVRPVIVLLMARALNSHIHGDPILSYSQQKVAMYAEMIHTASLIHDDVLDSSNMRRRKPSLNVIHDLKETILSADYILAVGAMVLASIGNNDVIIASAQILDDLITGELLQLRSKEDENERFNDYLIKSYKKTASLISNTCKSVAILSGGDKELQEIAFQYGRNVGIAFQLVDDLLDFVASSEMLGKPSATGLKLGLATAPVLFACEKFPELHKMIMRRFSKPGDIEKAVDAVIKSDGLDQTRFLAEKHCQEAIRHIQKLSPSPELQALHNITYTVLNRKK